MADERHPADDTVAGHSAAGIQLILGGRGSLYPGSEAEYWRASYLREPYFEAGRIFEDYGPAYELGWTGYHMYGGEFETANRVLANDWAILKGVSSLSWDEARPACRAAWQRAFNASSYTSDGSASAQEVIEALSELADNARDAELGFIEAAQHTETATLKAWFERRGQSCREGAAELQEMIVRLGGAPPEREGGSVSAAAHRAWLQIRGLFGGASDETLLAECARGEDAALSRYGRALQQNLPLEIHALVQRQFEEMQRHHDMLGALLGRMRAESQASSSVAT